MERENQLLASSDIRSALICAHTAAPAGLVQIHKVDFDLIDVALLVLADVVGDAASRWLLAVFVAKLHVQILLHMESILRIQSLPHKKDRDELKRQR